LASIYRGPVELSTIRLIRPLQVSQDVIASEAKQSMASPGDRLREAIHSRHSGAMRTGPRQRVARTRARWQAPRGPMTGSASNPESRDSPMRNCAS